MILEKIYNQIKMISENNKLIKHNNINKYFKIKY